MALPSRVQVCASETQRTMSRSCAEWMSPPRLEAAVLRPRGSPSWGPTVDSMLCWPALACQVAYIDRTMVGGESTLAPDRHSCGLTAPPVLGLSCGLPLRGPWSAHGRAAHAPF